MKPTRPVAIILEMFIHNAEWPAPANRLEFADDMLLLLLLHAMGAVSSPEGAVLQVALA